MLLPRLVLIPVEREHDRLEEDVDFGHGDESTEGSDVTRFGLEEEKQVSVGLANESEPVSNETERRSARAREGTTSSSSFLLLLPSLPFKLNTKRRLDGTYSHLLIIQMLTIPRVHLVQMFLNFLLLSTAKARKGGEDELFVLSPRLCELVRSRMTHLISSHPVLNEQRDPRIQVSHIWKRSNRREQTPKRKRRRRGSATRAKGGRGDGARKEGSLSPSPSRGWVWDLPRSSTKFFLDWEEILLFRSLSLFWAAASNETSQLDSTAKEEGSERVSTHLSPNHHPPPHPLQLP